VLDPPAGVDAELAGPVVTAADGEDDLARSMWLITLAALLVVAGLVAVARRSIEEALVAAIPLAFATGWTFLILFLLPIEVDFLTSALGAMVVAVCAGPTLLATRDRGPARVASDGRQAVAFGALAGAGLLALTVCDVPALRDLGAAGAVTLPLCGLGLAVSVPATLTWADRRGGLRVPRTRAELAAAGRGLAGSVRAAVRSVAGAGRRGAGGIGRGAGAVRRGVPRAGRKVRAIVTSRSRSA
jgi:predicted RND superfamily exporter protein